MPWRYTGHVNSRDRPAANWYEWIWVSHWCRSLRSKNSEIIVGRNANVAFHQCWLDHFCKMNRSCWLTETCNLKRKMWLVTWQLVGQTSNLRVFFCKALLKNTFKMISVGTNYFQRKKQSMEPFGHAMDSGKVRQRANWSKDRHFEADVCFAKFRFYLSHIFACDWYS